jgi:hypothetical protein
MRFSVAITGAVVPTLVLAHGGHDLEKEISRRVEFLKHARGDVSHCAAKMKERGLEDRAIRRRAKTAEALRRKRRIESRDLASVLATDHNQTAQGYDLDTPISELFATNKSCVLTPEGESGPFCKNTFLISNMSSSAVAGVDDSGQMWLASISAAT